MNKLYFILLGFTLLSLTACKKDDDDNDPPPVVPGPIELRENVHVIDSTITVLDFNASDFTNGTYVFNVNGTPPVINVNDVIIGAAGDGYIRIVTGVSVNGNIITLQTTQGNMEDVFKSGSFNFSIDMNGMNPGKKSAGFEYSVSNHILYSANGLNLTILNGSVSMDPNWFLNFSFSPAGIDTFEFSTTNTTLQANATIQATASSNVPLVNGTDTIASYTRLFTHWVTVGVIPVPVCVRLDIKLVEDYSASFNTSVSSTANISTTVHFSVGMKYINGQWQSIYNVTPTTNFSVTPPAGNMSLTCNNAIRPYVSVKLYGVAGPYANILAPTSELKGTLASPSLDWDLKAEGWLKTSVGADVTILGSTLASFGPQEWETTKLTVRTPNSIEQISGNDQTGNPNEALAEPIKVRVTDSRGIKQKNVPVYFEVTAGGGSFNPASILTDTNGYAEAIWTLGAPQSGTQSATVKAKYGDLTLINSAPIDFTAALSGSPMADFSASTTSINEGDAVNFIDLSTNSPTSWQWSFTGGTPSSSTDQNPTGVVYSTEGIYDVTLTATNNDGSDVETKTAYINVTTNDPCGGATTVTESNGNEISIVSIGNQCWMTENVTLSAGNYLNNTDFITNGQMGGPNFPAWTYSNDITSSDRIVYNWYQIDAGNMCPAGWHVPTNAEWQTLSDYLGGNTVAGGAMKITSEWNSPNTGATNSSGFSGRPSGGNTLTGLGFTSYGGYASYWGSDMVYSPITQQVGPFVGALNAGDALLFIAPAGGVSAASCRCIKD